MLEFLAGAKGGPKTEVLEEDVTTTTLSPEMSVDVPKREFFDDHVLPCLEVNLHCNILESFEGGRPDNSFIGGTTNLHGSDGGVLPHNKIIHEQPQEQILNTQYVDNTSGTINYSAAHLVPILNSVASAEVNGGEERLVDGSDLY